MNPWRHYSPPKMRPYGWRNGAWTFAADDCHTEIVTNPKRSRVDGKREIKARSAEAWRQTDG